MPVVEHYILLIPYYVYHYIYNLVSSISSYNRISTIVSSPISFETPELEKTINRELLYGTRI